MRLTLYAGNSMVLRLESLEDHNGDPVDDATVEAEITRGATSIWTGTLAAVSGAAGDYEATLPADLVVTVGERLAGTITAEAGGATLVDSFPIEVRRR